MEKRMMKKSYERIWMAAFAAVLFLAELMIGLYGKGFIRSYMGDVLVIPFLYCVIRIVLPERGFLLPAGLFVLGTTAEILQYMELCDRMGIAKNSLLGILLGSTGDVLDVMCYGIGAALVCGGIGIGRSRQKPR